MKKLSRSILESRRRVNFNIKDIPIMHIISFLNEMIW